MRDISSLVPEDVRTALKGAAGTLELDIDCEVSSRRQRFAKKPRDLASARAARHEAEVAIQHTGAVADVNGPAHSPSQGPRSRETTLA